MGGGEMGTRMERDGEGDERNEGKDGRNMMGEKYPAYLGGSHSTEQPGRPGGLILTTAMDDTDRIPIPEGKGMITDGDGQQTTLNTNDLDNTNNTGDLETTDVTDDLENSANNIDHEASTNGNDSDIAVTNNDEDTLTVNTSQETTIDRNDQQVTNADSYQQIMTADGGEEEEITPATTQNITTTPDIDSDVSEAVTTHTTSGHQNLTTQIIQLADQTSEPLTSPSIIDEDLCSALGNLRLDSSAADDVSVEAASESTAASGYTDSGFVVVETLDVSATVVAEDTQHQEDSCSSVVCDHDDDKDGEGSLTKDTDSHTSERDSQDLVERDINIIPPHEVEINTLSSHSDQTPHTDELHLVVPGNTEPNSEGSGSQRRHSTPRASWLLLNMLGDNADQQDEPRDQVQDVPETTPTHSQPEDISVPESAAETVSDPVGDASDPVLLNSIKTETENHMDGLEAEDVQKDSSSRVDECVSENDRIMNLRNTTDTQQMSGPAAGEELSPTEQTEQQEAQGTKDLPEAENVKVVSEDHAIGNISHDGVKDETTELHVMNEVHDFVPLSTPEEINSHQEQDNDSTSASKFAGVDSEVHVASVTKETEVNVVVNGGDIVHPLEDDLVSDKLSKLCVSESSMEVSNVSEEVVCESKLVSEESVVKDAVVSDLNMVSEMKEALVSEASVVSDVKQEIVSEKSIVTKCDIVSEGNVASTLEEFVSEKRSVAELKEGVVSEGSVVSEQTDYRVTSEDKMITDVVSNNVSEVKEETLLSVVETVSTVVSDEKENFVSESKVVSEEFVSDINQELLSEVKKETVSESKVVSEVKEEVVSEAEVNDKMVSEVEVREEVVAQVMQQMVSEVEKEVVSEVKEEVMAESKSVSEVKEEVMEKVVAESILLSESVVSEVKETVVTEDMVSEVKEKVVSEDIDEVVSEVKGEEVVSEVKDVVSEVKGEEVVSDVNQEVVSEVKEVVSDVKEVVVSDIVVPEVKVVVSEVKEVVVSDIVVPEVKEVVSEVKEEVVSEVKEVVSEVKEEVVSEVKEVVSEVKEVVSDSTTLTCEVDKDLSVTQAAEKFVASVFEEAGMAMEKSHTHEDDDEEEEKTTTTTTPMQEGKDEVGGVTVPRVMSEESSGGVKDGTEEPAGKKVSDNSVQSSEKVDTSQSEAPLAAEASEEAGSAAAAAVGGNDEEEQVQEAEEAIAYQPLAGKKSKKKCCIL
ncbi:hypothetical protein Pmani_027315 [Petrolisthes manimaculis]|uniref:Uncharacterized protein n=1 Tax=Petrolisthes manimaculis TaxID=1843537 RepID=A0AAE1P4I0_9EUCA|nr:hypothetical protein Pmani_027315 [Petrolisthes manimaculis]